MATAAIETPDHVPFGPSTTQAKELQHIDAQLRPHIMTTMFGALNRFIARLDAAPEEQSGASNGIHNASGFQVLKNTNADVPLDPWFDFIIGINGRTIDSPDPNLFATEVRNCAGSTISLGVYCAKGQRIRETYIPIPAQSPSLGMSLQWTPLAVTEDVWHILDVIPDSPADAAGLLPYGDYVIGSPEGLMRGELGLSELIEDYLNRPLRLYVYNHEYDVTRPVTITPSRGWGGEGALGCLLGFGALHRIPASLEEPPQAPGETLFSRDGASFDEKRAGSPGAAHNGTFAQAQPTGTATELFVPANMALPSKSPPPQAGQSGPPKRAKQRAHHAQASPAGAGGGGGGLDDYFKEGEEKSAAEDFAPKAAAAGVPPPPKVGGPPKGPPKSATPAPASDAVEFTEDGAA